MNRREALKRVGLLMGGTLSAPAIAGILGGCRAGGGTAWAPQTLTSDQNELVVTLSELIIPETDTPGAKAARVNEFIDRMMTEWYPDQERERFLAGLADVDARARQAHGNAFVACAPEEQAEILAVLDREAAARQEPPPDPDRVEDIREKTEGTDEGPLEEPLESDTLQAQRDTAGAPPEETGVPFFRTLKELTLLGYYTSEIGASQELRWMAWPGHYDGCVPTHEVGRTWA